MRTTLNVDDEILEVLRALSRARGVSIGQVVSDLARRALRPSPSVRDERGFPVFDVPDDAPTFGSEDVWRAEDEA